MTTKADFTAQEWERIMQAPVMAGTYIIVADLSVTAVFREVAGMTKAMTSVTVPAAAQDLVSDVVADLKALAEERGKMEPDLPKEGGDPKPEILNQIRGTLALLDEKATPEEKTGFATWLLDVAQATAEAGKEGGFLGIGAVRVSDAEKAALSELKGVLHLT